MARPRSFDETQALRAAVQVFWVRGYPDAGVRDLCEAMGIRSGSFYATFECKSSLFVRAVDQYVADLGLPEPSVAAARRYLARIAEARQPTGCLLALSASERHALDPAGRAAVDHQIRRLDRWLQACLNDRPTAQAQSDGALLATFAWGLQVQHRAGIPVHDLQRRVHRMSCLIGIDSTDSAPPV